MVETLIWVGVDMEKAKQREWQAIHVAALNGYTEVIECLLQSKVDPDQPSKRLGNRKTSAESLVTRAHPPRRAPELNPHVNGCLSPLIQTRLFLDVLRSSQI